MKRDNIVIEIDESDLGTLYPELGKGVEGTVYEYKNQVLKILDGKEVSLPTIIDRLKYLVNIKVSNVVFPENLVYNTDKKIIGYSMKLVIPNEYKSFFNLLECKDNKKFVDYFINIQETMKELHKKRIYVGDFNPNNIMIGKDENPVFIDTINYATPEFDFLLKPYNSMIYEKLFSCNCSLLDNDKFMFAFLFLSYFIPFNDLEKAIKDAAYFKKIIDKFNISNQSKEILNKIFSSSDNKEYLDNVLLDFKDNEHPKYDNKFGRIIKTIFSDNEK